jgi:hypothetical protein
MKNRPSKAARGARQVPLDHLRPGGRHPSDPDRSPAADRKASDPPSAEDLAASGAEPATSGGPPTGAEPSEPSEPATPGAGDADAVRGKATGSLAAVATRPHLEGSEQGPS